MQAKDVIEIHKERCENFDKTIQISIDGVSESKSTTNTMDVFSVRFNKCRTIYPLKIVRPIGKYKIDFQELLDDFLTDICSNRCPIHSFIGDNPMRARARASKAHSAYFACEYCEAKGKLLNEQDIKIKATRAELHRQKNEIQEQISILQQNNGPEHQITALNTILKSTIETLKTINKKNNNIVWPVSTMSGVKRTVESILEIVRKIDSNNILSLDEAKGILGRSLFLDIPYFHIVLDMPTEYLHSLCLGVVKRTVCLTFNVGDRKLSEVVAIPGL